MPVQPGAGQSLTALGNLNPPGHVLPTDHVYFYSGDLSARTPFTNTGQSRDVLMPVTGAVIFILPNNVGEVKLMFRVTQNFYFYFDHLRPAKTYAIGDIVTVGTKVGTTTPDAALDLGAFDFAATNTGFVTPARYGDQTLHVVSPWKYFTPALQAQLYPQVYRKAGVADKDGRIDFGIAGKLAGDWFLQGMPNDSSTGPFGWTRSLSFAYDYYDPNSVRISVGGTIGPAGVWGIDSSKAPRPENVTPADGVVPYLLYSGFDPGFPPQGLLLVQMLDASTIKVELFMGVTTTNRSFDANAWTFVR